MREVPLWQLAVRLGPRKRVSGRRERESIGWCVF